MIQILIVLGIVVGGILIVTLLFHTIYKILSCILQRKYNMPKINSEYLAEDYIVLSFIALILVAFLTVMAYICIFC